MGCSREGGFIMAKARKCPKCGGDLVFDNHRRYPVEMCYQCGYMDGQKVTGQIFEIDNSEKLTVMQGIYRMGKGSLALFLTQCDFKGALESDIREWLDQPLKPFIKK